MNKTHKNYLLEKLEVNLRENKRFYECLKNSNHMFWEVYSHEDVTQWIKLNEASRYMFNEWMINMRDNYDIDEKGETYKINKSSLKPFRFQLFDKSDLLLLLSILNKKSKEDK